MSVADDEHVVLVSAARRLPWQRLGFDFGRSEVRVGFVVLFVDVDARLAFDSRQVSLVPEQCAVGDEDRHLVGAKRLRLVDDDVLLKIGQVLQFFV